MLSTVLLSVSAFAVPQSPQATPAPQRPLIEASTRHLQHLGITLKDSRFLESATGRIVREVTNEATGAAVNFDAMLAREFAAAQTAAGKLSHELVDQLDNADSNQTFDVVFWLRSPAALPDLREVLDAAIDNGQHPEDARRSALAVAATHMETVTTPFSVALRDAGTEPTYVDAYTPVVFASLRPATIRTLAMRADVDQVYYSFPTWMDEETPVALPNDQASPTARTDAVHRRGITGAGVKVLINDTQNVYPNSAFMPTVTTGSGNNVANHASAVAGITASSHPTFTGAAPGMADIYSYGGSGDTNAPLAWSWGMTQGISFGNCSWWNGNRGSIVFLDRYFDYIIRQFAVMMFKSCGNQGNGNPTTTPGNGFNTTASGNANDGNTHDWDNDVMSGSSSTGNPQPSNHEKPEVTSHGSGITTLRSSGAFSAAGSGTSYASPVTCGTAALLASTDNALLAKPEVVKAMLMAGAWNNIRGASRLSDYDGAGAIDAAASQAGVAANQYVSDTLTAASFTNGFYEQTLSLDQGDTTRIVALWFSLANSAATSTTLNMDLDMIVLDPSGTSITTSASPNNPFEIVEFVPAMTGTYTVRMQNIRFNGASEPFALAWTTLADAATNEVRITGTPALGSTLSIEWFDRYHPGSTYIGVLSATPYPGTWTLPTNRVVRLGYDFFAQASHSLPGFIGALGPQGSTTTQLPIPNIPGLSGMTFYFGMVTVETGQAVIEETSGATAITLQ